MTRPNSPLIVALDWIQHHCRVPDGFARGKPFRLYDFQLKYLSSHYLVKGSAQWDPDSPTLGPAFVYQRSLLVMSQKALALDTPIATPSGWTTMADVRPGDFVFDAAGRPTRVIGKSEIFNSDTYRVTFSDHSQLVACGDHEWVIERRTSSGSYVPERLSTRAMLDMGMTIYGAKRFRVSMNGPLSLPEADLPVHPYTLGAWLGDGGQHDARITGIDLEVFKEIESEGYSPVQDAKITKRWRIGGLQSQLNAAGLLRNKHIPAAYLRASIEQRWSLLQGLMDTDGYCDDRQGKCEFTTVTPALRDGFMELLRSLGIKFTLVTGRSSLYGVDKGPKWRIQFAARSDMSVFRIPRKTDRLRPPGGTHAQYGHRRIVSIEPVETISTQCLTVDSPSHTFLAGWEMIPTGNSGKGPLFATQLALEGAGPALFAGWAGKDDGYACADNGCPCGWEYAYDEGEPMGMRWPTPLIQITAFAEDQTENIYRPFRSMVRLGPLADVFRVGQKFTKIIDTDEGRIDVVTSSAQSRLGAPVTFVAQDEVGIWVKVNGMDKVADTQYRGLAGMGGRAGLSTNAWDPSEQSVAQTEYETDSDDVYKQFVQPPPNLSYRNKEERRKIHRFVYGDVLKQNGGHVDLDSIESEAYKLLQKDPAQAERFFGNKIVYGQGAWLKEGLWAGHAKPRPYPAKYTQVCLGFDGSLNNDWTSIKAETVDGYLFTPTYGPDKRPARWNPAEWPGGEIPRGEVRAAWDEIHAYFKVRRGYYDPEDWESEIDQLALAHGAERAVIWRTNRIAAMYDAIRRFETDLVTGAIAHDGDRVTETHVANARKVAKPAQKYLLGKPNETQKIDDAMAAILAHEAAADARAEGWKRWATAYAYSA